MSNMIEIKTKQNKKTVKLQKQTLGVMQFFHSEFACIHKTKTSSLQALIFSLFIKRKIHYSRRKDKIMLLCAR